jgi:hypothetical protein
VNAIKELTEPARFLRNAAPQQFNDFLAVFERYTDQQVNKVVIVGEHIQLAQGHAQQCVKILQTLKEARDG